MRKLLLLLLLLCPLTVMAQGGGQQGGYPAYRFRRLAADPATCTTGDVYFNYVTPAYRKCQTTNTWTDFTFSGGAFTSPALGPDGSAALPTYSFSSDPNTGMFRSAADAIGFSTGGTERWVINSSGALNPFIDNTYDIGNGSVNPRDVNISRKLILGKAATNTGQIDLAGTTSGVVSLKTADAAGTWTLTLPTTDGDSGQALTTNGSGVASWTTIAAGTTINATDGVIPYRSSSTAFSDSPLARVNANTVKQSNTTNAQTFQVFNTDDGAGNAEWLEAKWDANYMFLQANKSGTGTVRSIVIGGAGDGIYLRPNGGSSATGIKVASAGNGLLFESDNAMSIGTAGATRPSSIFLGTGIAIEATITAAGTTGAQTINKTAGSVNFAAAASSLVVTNSTVTATSIVMCTVATNDATLKSVQCVAASGSFTMFGNAAATAETRVNFWVLTPD